MDQVWQATDTQLNRQVALKILPDAFAADPDRLARFTREAQILASLNQPNIAAIYGIEEAEGTRALVLERRGEFEGAWRGGRGGSRISYRPSPGRVEVLEVRSDKPITKLRSSVTHDDRCPYQKLDRRGKSSDRVRSGAPVGDL